MSSADVSGFRGLVVASMFFIGGAIAFAQPLKQPVTLEQSLIEENRSLSDRFDRIAEGLDIFLARQANPSLRNRTRVVVENTTFSTEGEKPKNSTHLRLSLHLPNLEESWQLKFTTYDEDEEERDTQSRYIRRTPRETNYGTSLAVFRKLGKVRTTFQPRIQLEDPLKVSHILKFDMLADMGSYKVDPKVEFFARPDKGTGVFGALNFAFILSKYYTFQLVNEGEYQERKNMFSVTNGFSVTQKVTQRSWLSYAQMFASNNRPTYHLEGYAFSVGWNHLLYKNVLHYQLVPHIGFPKSGSYKGKTGLTFSINLIF